MGEIEIGHRDRSGRRSIWATVECGPKGEAIKIHLRGGREGDDTREVLEASDPGFETILGHVWALEMDQ